MKMTKTSMVSDWRTLTGAGKVVGQEFFRGTAGEPKNGILYAIDRRVDTASREINALEVDHADIALHDPAHVIFTNAESYNKIVLGVKFILDTVALPTISLAQSNIKFVLDGGAITTPIDATAGIGIQLNDLIWQKATAPDLPAGGGVLDDFLSVYIPLHITLESGETIAVSTLDGIADLFGAADFSYEITVIG